MNKDLEIINKYPKQYLHWFRIERVALLNKKKSFYNTLKCNRFKK